jgi:hypothetical protein
MLHKVPALLPDVFEPGLSDIGLRAFRIGLTHCASTKLTVPIVHQSEGGFGLDNHIARALLEESFLQSAILLIM